MLTGWMTGLWTYSPNCGSGAWLTAWYEKLRKLSSSTHDQSRLHLPACLSSSDSTPGPADLAESNLV